MINPNAIPGTTMDKRRPPTLGWLDSFLLRAGRKGEAVGEWWLLDNLVKIPTVKGTSERA